MARTTIITLQKGSLCCPKCKSKKYAWSNSLLVEILIITILLKKLRQEIPKAILACPASAFSPYLIRVTTGHLAIVLKRIIKLRSTNQGALID